MNRRQFVRSVGQSSAAVMMGLHTVRLWGQPQKELPVDCAPPRHGRPKQITFDRSASVQPRKSVWALSQGELDRLNAAYAALRELSVKDPNDPRGWMQQAHVHCFNCSGGYDPSNVEIHGSWWFLPWHRCYLHVHERILGKLIGDPNFRLAYWDWDTYPQHAILPPPFVPPGPLYDAYRGAAPTTVIPANITGPAAMSVVLHHRTTDGFMGQLSDPPKNKYYPGALENSPHGPVHLWTGYPASVGASSPEPVGCYYPNTAGGQPVDQSENGCMDMGVLATAAQDPVFFAHHGNIDRLWDVWRGMPDSEGNPTSTDWLNHTFNFYDENGDWVYIKIADVIDQFEQVNLRYTYQPPPGATPAALTLETPERTTRRLNTVRSLPRVTVHAPDAPVAVGTRPHTQRVELPDAHQTNLARFASARGASRRRYVLVIEGLTLPAAEGAILEVYIGEDDPARANANRTGFLGVFSVVPTGHRGHHPVVRDARFELRPATAAMLSTREEIHVTLIPRLPNGREPRRSSLTYRRIYLTVE